MKLTLDWLKANCKMVHYFGLGFIQLKLDKHHRIHFYTKKLPPIISDEDVHNHRYDFVSTILHGTFTQELYDVIPGETHLLEDESCQIGINTECTPKPCGLKLNSRHSYMVNSEYFISHETFHRVISTDCITFLTRTDYKKELAQVVRPVGQEKVCPFSKQIPEEELWSIIDEIIRGI